MRTFLISFVVFFFIFIFIYLIYSLFNKVRFTLKGVAICLIVSFPFAIYSCLKLNKTVDDLREELDEYPQSVIAEYLRDEYDFSEIVEMYGDDELSDYIWYRYNITLP